MGKAGGEWSVGRPTQASSGELLGGGLVGAHPVENPLHKDDSDVDVAGDAGKKLRDEVVLGFGGVSDHDALGGGGAVAGDAGDVEVADFGADGIGEKGSVVRNHVAVIVLSDEGLVEGVEDAARDAPFRPAMVMRILAGQGGDKEGAEELAGGVLQIAVADVLAEAAPSGSVSGVSVAADGVAGGAHDGNRVEGVGQVAEGEAGLLLRSKRYRSGGVEEALVGVRGGS